HAVAAPRGADAGLHRAQCLAVGVARLEAGVGQVLPDVRQLLDSRAEQVDPLRAGDLGVEAVLLRYVTEHDQLLRRDLAARHPRHDGIGAVFLQVGEEMVVGVLQRRMPGLQDHLVPARREDRRRRRLADVAAPAFAVSRNQIAEGLDRIYFYEMKKLLARVGEVLAQVVGDGAPLLLELGVDDRFGERAAAAAAGCAFRRLLQRAKRRHAAAHRFADLPLRYAVAG